MSRFGQNIRIYVDIELQSAIQAEAQSQSFNAFAFLERAHVLAQSSTFQHIRVHWFMFLWGLRQRNVHECLGQILRIAGAATKTAIGFIPEGNTGGSNISPFKKLPIPTDLADIINLARK